ncbi:hypothetical protein C2U55_15560 [Enterobacteriaceae bacterium ENNIH3]|nr:hypothetical protein C2U55_15560 [Enterobacteriaceae bacterium ENNIH3]AUV09520.1 hypothetical protein C2U52_26335 [Enterobacteriaceae bacterium ENNIH2]PWF51151.1 hypothetical protein BHT19_0009415 [[Kluyvera] intestini]
MFKNTINVSLVHYMPVGIDLILQSGFLDTTGHDKTYGVCHLAGMIEKIYREASPVAKWWIANVDTWYWIDSQKIRFDSAIKYWIDIITNNSRKIFTK